MRQNVERGLAGAYTVERELAGGGMSHVFVADEVTLRRKVVVKVLRPELAEGLSAERFKREIDVGARLQHLHIVPLLTSGTLPDGSLYYTMPFVEGESLRTRLEREGALPIGDVVRILRDVASALAYAHGRGVVHRDIKPENILLSHGGAIVADFGIAKAISASRTTDDGDATRRSSTLTAAGTSLGTPAYMAPEQAVGDSVDHRADLYAMGVVGYEMLCGRPLFDGRSAQQLLAAHATQLPESIERRRAATPATLGVLVMRLLSKNPADRIGSAEEVVRSLDDAAVSRLESTAPEMPSSANYGATGSQRHPDRRNVVALVGVLLTAAALSAAVALAVERRLTPHVPPLKARLLLELPADARLDISGVGNSLSLSPDGATLVYVGGTNPPRLYVRPLDSLTPRPLPGTELGGNPRFSPDGRWIAFRLGNDLAKVPVAGGPVMRIASNAGRFVWSPDGSLVFTKLVGGFFSGLSRVSAEGGAPEEIIAPNSGSSAMAANDLTPAQNGGSPTVLPDGETVVFTALSRGGDLTLAAVRIHEHRLIPLGIVGGGATYLDGGYLLFSRFDGSLNAVRFDPKALRVLGEPVRVLDSVAVKPGGAPELTISNNTGTLAYLRGNLGARLVEFDRHGAYRTLISTPRSYGNPRVSPDGRHIVLSIGEPYASDVWLYDLSGTLTRLSDAGNSGRPEWTPDGRRIAWTSIAPGKEGVWWQPWDQSAAAELLVPKARGSVFGPRGDFVLTRFDTPNGAGADVRMVPLPYDPGRATQLVLPGSVDERQLSLSPDGRWLAYVSNETGTREVFIQRVPGPGSRIPVSAGGGTNPRWAPNGKELFYVVPACCLMSATITTSPELSVVRRDSLFSVRGISTGIALSPDGNHFVTARVNSDDVSNPILVFGFAEEVRARVARGR